MHSLFVGRVQYRGMLFGRLKAVACKVYGRERLIIKRFEGPCGSLRPITGRSDIAKSFRSGESQRDRQPHVWWRSLRNGGAITELDHRMHDGLRVHGHLDAAWRHVEQSARLNHFQALVHQRGRVDGYDRPHMPSRMVQCAGHHGFLVRQCKLGAGPQRRNGRLKTNRTGNAVEYHIGTGTGHIHHGFGSGGHFDMCSSRLCQSITQRLHGMLVEHGHA